MPPPRDLQRATAAVVALSGNLVYVSHVHAATRSAIMAAQAPDPSNTPTRIPRAAGDGLISDSRSSIGMLGSWSSTLIVNSR